MLPIDKLSLVHGTYDAGRTIRYHQEVFEKLQPALASLNLAVRTASLFGSSFNRIAILYCRSTE